MILVRLTDGLGNQLFQYAAAQTLCQRLGTTAKFLVDAFDARRARPDRPLLLPELVPCGDRLLPTRSLRGLYAVALHRALRPRRAAVRHIPGLCYFSHLPGHEPGFDRIADGEIVSGYFQARGCAMPSIGAVREAVSHRFGPRIGAARRALEAITPGGGRLVALHLRLGDYVKIGDGREAIVPIERVRAVLAGIEPGARIVGFTDSPARFERTDFGQAVPRFAGDGPLADFAAMTACDDFIIANSTFSWWASTLGASAEKRVWAPRDWLRPARIGSDPSNPIYLDDHRLY